MLEERMNRRPAAGTYFGHKTRNCHPYIMQSWVIDAYGNGCNEVYGADSTETQWGGQWIVNEGMRDRKEKKKLREDERGGHEFRKSTECSGLSLRSLSHNDICLTDYSQLKKKNG